MRGEGGAEALGLSTDHVRAPRTKGRRRGSAAAGVDGGRAGGDGDDAAMGHIGAEGAEGGAEALGRSLHAYWILP